MPLSRQQKARNTMGKKKNGKATASAASAAAAAEESSAECVEATSRQQRYLKFHVIMSFYINNSSFFFFLGIRMSSTTPEEDSSEGQSTPSTFGPSPAGGFIVHSSSFSCSMPQHLDLEQKNGQLIAAAKKNQDRIQQLEQELKQARDREDTLETANQQYIKSLEEYAKIKEEHDKIKEERVNIKEEHDKIVAELKKDNERLTTIIEDQKRTIANLEDKIAKQDKKIAEQDKKIAEQDKKMACFEGDKIALRIRQLADIYIRQLKKQHKVPKKTDLFDPTDLANIPVTQKLASEADALSYIDRMKDYATANVAHGWAIMDSNNGTLDIKVTKAEADAEFHALGLQQPGLGYVQVLIEFIDRQGWFAP
jgi:hypothetical protein